MGNMMMMSELDETQQLLWDYTYLRSNFQTVSEYHKGFMNNTTRKGHQLFFCSDATHPISTAVKQPQRIDINRTPQFWYKFQPSMVTQMLDGDTHAAKDMCAAEICAVSCHLVHVGAKLKLHRYQEIGFFGLLEDPMLLCKTKYIQQTHHRNPDSVEEMCKHTSGFVTAAFQDAVATCAALKSAPCVLQYDGTLRGCWLQLLRQLVAYACLRAADALISSAPAAAGMDAWRHGPGYSRKAAALKRVLKAVGRWIETGSIYDE
jgi:hypothetical protein